jgi:pimeloyl-ACP methyl ester carboxylesterase
MRRVLLLPGLGADARIFEAQSESLDIVVPPWPMPAEKDSLQSFAGKLAPAVPDGVDVIGGASFGGMVALELAAILRPKAVVLVGSCRRPDSIATRLRILGNACSRVPDTLFRPRRWTLPLVLPKFGKLTPAQQSLFWRMATGVPSSFFKWGCAAILAWRPSPVTSPVFHLHGDEDQIIPIRRVMPTQVVRGGGHLLSLSHPREVTTFISGAIHGG